MKRIKDSKIGRLKDLKIAVFVTLAILLMLPVALHGFGPMPMSATATSDSLDTIRVKMWLIETGLDDSVPAPYHIRIIAPIKSTEIGDTLDWELDTTDVFVFGSGYLVTSAEPDSALLSKLTILGFISDSLRQGQWIIKDYIDTTSSNFVFDDAYKVTSAEADSMLATIYGARDAAGDSIRQTQWITKTYIDTTAGLVAATYHLTTSAEADSGLLGAKTIVDTVKLTKLDDFATPDDNTDLNASTTYHGLLPKLDNDDTHYLDGQGNWSGIPSTDVYVWAYRSGSDQALAVSTWTKIQFNGEVQDLGSDWNTTTHEFTAPDSGFYSIDARCQVDAVGGADAAGHVSIAIYRNDSLMVYGNKLQEAVNIGGIQEFADNDSPVVGATLYVPASGTIQIYAYQSFDTGGAVIKQNDETTWVTIRQEF